jgi:hypothetical protein
VSPLNPVYVSPRPARCCQSTMPPRWKTVKCSIIAGPPGCRAAGPARAQLLASATAYTAGHCSYTYEFTRAYANSCVPVLQIPLRYGLCTQCTLTMLHGINYNAPYYCSIMVLNLVYIACSLEICMQFTEAGKTYGTRFKSRNPCAECASGNFVGSCGRHGERGRIGLVSKLRGR